MIFKNEMAITLAGTSFTDELHTNYGASAKSLRDTLEVTGHDYFRSLTIRTASGGGGTALVLGVDYNVTEKNDDLSARASDALGTTVNIYKKVTIINATYQTGNLYFSGYYHGDAISAVRVNADVKNNYSNMGLLTAALYNDAGVLKLSTGLIGINDGSYTAILDITSITTLDFTGITNGYWFSIEMSRSNDSPVFTLADLAGETTVNHIPDVSAYFKEYKNGFYLTSTKRLIGLGYKNSSAALARIYTMKSNTRFYIPDSAVGEIKMYAGATAPTGYLLCDGASLLRASYPDLFALLGTTYGSVDGSHFNVPDFGGIFPRGAGTSTKLTNANSVAFAGVLGTYQNDKYQGFQVRSPNNYATSAGGPPYDKYIVGATGSASNTGVTSTPLQQFTTDGTNGTPRTGTETNPANLGINFIIKY